MSRSELSSILNDQELHPESEEQHTQEDGVCEETTEYIKFCRARRDVTKMYDTIEVKAYHR